MSPSKPTERQIEVNKIYHDLNCSVRATSRHLGIRRHAVKKSLKGGQNRGLVVSPDKSSPVAPPGWSSRKKTIQYNKKGIVQVWDKLIPEDISLDLFIKSFNKESIPECESKVDPPEQNGIEKDVCFVWPCVDIHVGLAAWKPETLDSNYDLKICKKLEDVATVEMLKKVGCVDQIHLSFLGDTTHTDNKTNMTPMSGNILDVDSRYDKIVWTAKDIIVNKIERSLACANIVSVDIVKGNHDPNTSVGMLMAIDAYYRNEPRVKVNISPAQFKFFHWGVSFVMGCHGHEAPPSRLSSFLMDYVIQNSVTAKELYVYKANIHHRKKEIIIGMDETDGGVLVETFPTLTAKDSWHASKAFSSKRATLGKLFHKRDGLIDDVGVSAKYLAYKYGIK